METRRPSRQDSTGRSSPDLIRLTHTRGSSIDLDGTPPPSHPPIVGTASTSSSSLGRRRARAAAPQPRRRESMPWLVLQSPGWRRSRREDGGAWGIGCRQVELCAARRPPGRRRARDGPGGTAPVGVGEAACAMVGWISVSFLFDPWRRVSGGQEK
jgi:hypothetical protein